MRRLAPVGPAAEHHQLLEYTRDKFLLCAYTALRISDADRLAPEHLHGDVARSQVMLVTGHQTEAGFNVYLGIDESEMPDSYRKTARRIP